MGYSTSYTLTTLTEDGKARTMREGEIQSYIEDFIDYDPFDDRCKWYDHEEEMKEISKAFPTDLIQLHGEGEESGDIWDKYFLNGKMQICKAQIVLPPFDSDKLK